MSSLVDTVSHASDSVGSFASKLTEWHFVPISIFHDIVVVTVLSLQTMLDLDQNSQQLQDLTVMCKLVVFISRTRPLMKLDCCSSSLATECTVNHLHRICHQNCLFILRLFLTNLLCNNDIPCHCYRISYVLVSLFRRINSKVAFCC